MTGTALKIITGIGAIDEFGTGIGGWIGSGSGSGSNFFLKFSKFC
jgi:hypothetical protein